ncbi:double-stranded RNA-binding protein 2 [Phtheirospermum japonicum]|uniref:Double-stranded RNA-binding protein 2 n=1 Tax=Phtheirospermum japonicum TaxID=374723 RepID=A0A830BL75_9LAMI|nr:double-stranded RNA-binding protein 2 [Phtheirospermum japonicum]
MYKNQLQELAQRSCFNLPSYTCIREGPDHAPRFKAAVNFNGETFESPNYCSTLRQAEHSAAEMALNSISSRGPSNSLAARILDETGVYKNLLQEVSCRVALSLPAYTTFRTVVQQPENPKSEKPHKDELEHVTVARALQKYLINARLARVPFPIKFPTITPKPSSTHPPPPTTSKILPFICPKAALRSRPGPAVTNASFQKIMETIQTQPIIPSANETQHSQKFPAAGAQPYIPIRHCNPHNRAPPVTIRNSIPVFSAPPIPSAQSSRAPPVCVRQAVPNPVRAPVRVEDPRQFGPSPGRAENLMFSRASPGRLDKSPFSKLSSVRVDETLGSKSLSARFAPSSGVQSVQLEVPSSESPKDEIELLISKLQASAGTEDLKELRI